MEEISESNDRTHRNIDRGLYHAQFCKGMTDVFYPVMLTIVEAYDSQWNDSEECGKIQDPCEKLEYFKSFVKGKMKDIKFESVKSHIQNFEKANELLKTMNENYIRMNSVKDPESIIKTTLSDMFFCIYAITMRRICMYVYLFNITHDRMVNMKNKTKLCKIIKEAISDGIERSMPLNFISSDKNDIIKVMTNDGKYISIDRQKFLDFYNHEKSYKYTNDEMDEEKDEERVTIETPDDYDDREKDKKEDREKDRKEEKRDSSDSSDSSDEEFERRRERKKMV